MVMPHGAVRLYAHRTYGAVDAPYGHTACGTVAHMPDPRSRRWSARTAAVHAAEAYFTQLFSQAAERTNKAEVETN
jgi:hypothetical protein